MITSRIPPQNKLPHSYINYLYKIVNAEDTATTEMPPIPVYTKVKMKWTAVSKKAFARGIYLFKI